MQVSYNAIIREMDAEELQEELEKVKADKSMFTTGKLFEIERN
ncbi:hypothetical protein [Nostoc linckia]|nr:hypothetical protein [Nostoc linckia]